MRLIHKSSFRFVSVFLLIVISSPGSASQDPPVFPLAVYNNLNTTLMGGLDSSTLSKLDLLPPQHNGERALVYYHEPTKKLVTFIQLKDKGVIVAIMSAKNSGQTSTASQSKIYSSVSQMFIDMFPGQAVPEFILETSVASHGGYFTTNSFDANCSFEVDGPVFDDFWAMLGWSKHHYYNSVVTISTIALFASDMKTHLCHDHSHSKGGFLVNQPTHQLWIELPNKRTRRTGQYDIYPMVSQYVLPSRRSLFQIFSSSRRWRARAKKGPINTGVMRLGIMAP
ncbi:hypothetical protein MNBD_GAMMA12-3522 [hydrothermal vent metagenome]|uniref:Uncharacterized protein n=1 Tax=hydrothermal vent metagenome TaxID=652676 RepID=A0A3B0Y4U8_9ZZZZ